MSRVLVVDAQHRALDPCRPARARLLLKQRKAAVLRYAPFTIILQEAKPEVEVSPLRVKIDPGATTTGLAVVNDRSGEVVWAAGQKSAGPASGRAPITQTPSYEVSACTLCQSTQAHRLAPTLLALAHPEYRHLGP